MHTERHIPNEKAAIAERALNSYYFSIILFTVLAKL